MVGQPESVDPMLGYCLRLAMLLILLASLVLIIRSVGTDAVSFSAPDRRFPFRQDRPVVREWTMTDFKDSDVSGTDRDVRRGKAIFVVAACLQCHRVQRVGSPLGPDLTGIGRRSSPMNVLRDTLDPNAEITKDYQTTVVLTEEGQQLTGIVAREDQSTIWLAVDPLREEKPLVIQKDHVDMRMVSRASSMPTGLLDTFAREEILDLIAFLCSYDNR